MILNESKARELLYSDNKTIIVKGISIKDEFDDICYGDFGYWARICNNHSKLDKYRSLGHIDSEYVGDTDALCDCRNCTNLADYYIDFFNDSAELKPIFDENL